MRSIFEKLKTFFADLDLNSAKKSAVIIAIVIIAAVITGNYIVHNKNRSAEIKIDYTQSQETVADSKNESETVFVHIKGEVLKPNIYEVPTNSRIKDVVDIAGGFTENADIEEINLAEKIKDEQEIYVPNKSEKSSESKTSKSASKSSSAKSNASSQTIININTATKDELMRLPGIGPSYATAIIKYREENGKFESKEDLLKIKGIGSSRYREIEPLIKI